jgi:hypothetical protein
MASGIQSSDDDRIRVLSIAASTFADARGAAMPTTAVVVGFRSRQDASDGYRGQTCSNWTVTYQLIDVPAWATTHGQTRYRILGSTAQAPAAC